MSRTDRELFDEALLHLRRAKLYGAEDLTKDLVIDAVSMRLVAMIDALNRISDGVVNECLGGDWVLMRGIRNRIVHGYMSVDPEVVRVTVTEELTAGRRSQDSGVVVPLAKAAT